MGSPECGMEADVNLKIAETGQSPECWAWPHMWGSNTHPWPLVKQLGAIVQVGCQQETQRGPHQIGEEAVWVAEVWSSGSTR